jgi:acetyl-CoA carboxylase carboxyltransferase component
MVKVLLLIQGGESMNKLEELAHRKELSYFGGVEEKIKIQHGMNKMTARERIDFLLDEGSFIEFGALVGNSGSSVITGYGTINGRLVYLYSEDYTVDGGLIGIENSMKICNIMELAIKMGAPLIQIIDSIGAKVSEGINILSAYGRIIGLNSKLSGVVPQITVVAGPCTGIAAISAAMGDITIITENSGELYINSPKVIEEIQNKHTEKEMYSRAETASRNGSVHILAKDDEEALKVVRTLVDYLPSNNLEFPNANSSVSTALVNKSLDEFIDMDSYEIRDVIKSIVDSGNVLELSEHISDSVVTAFVKINGIPAGIVASNKRSNEGRFDIKTCEKAARFIKLCNSFNISLVTLVDSKGFVADAVEENKGLAVAAAKLMYSLSEANVPKISLIIGECYGAGYISMASKETGFDVIYAWPAAKISIAEPESIVRVLNKEDIATSSNPNKKKAELLNSYIENNVNVYKAAENGLVDDVIVPSETTLRLYAVLDMLQSKKIVKYPKKYGSTLT